MDDLVKKINSGVDYSKYSFEDMHFNPYEVCIAVSKYAREVNDKARKMLGTGSDIYPRNLAIKKLLTNSFDLVYEQEGQEKP